MPVMSPFQPLEFSSEFSGLFLNIFRGLHGVVGDYARPFVIGKTLAKMAHIMQYIFTALMLAGEGIFFINSTVKTWLNFTK